MKNVKQKAKRTNSIYPGGIGIPTRTLYLPWGQTVSADSFPGTYGIPPSVPVRRIIHEQGEYERRRIGKMIRFIKSHPIVIPYCVFMPLVGAFFQGWLAWAI